MTSSGNHRRSRWAPMIGSGKFGSAAYLRAVECPLFKNSEISSMPHSAPLKGWEGPPAAFAGSSRISIVARLAPFLRHGEVWAMFSPLAYLRLLAKCINGFRQSGIRGYS